MTIEDLTETEEFQHLFQAAFEEAREGIRTDLENIRFTGLVKFDLREEEH